MPLHFVLLFPHGEPGVAALQQWRSAQRLRARSALLTCCARHLQDGTPGCFMSNWLVALSRWLSSWPRGRSRRRAKLGRSCRVRVRWACSLSCCSWRCRYATAVHCTAVASAINLLTACCRRCTGTARGKVTAREFGAFRLFQRIGESDHLFRGGRLFQEYICDMHGIVDQQRLQWVEHNQDKLRSAVYSGVQVCWLRAAAIACAARGTWPSFCPPPHVPVLRAGCHITWRDRRWQRRPPRHSAVLAHRQ